MKCALTFLLLFFLINCSFAQFEFININDDLKSKGLMVKELSIYYFETGSDSTLTAVNTYDSLGGRLTTRTFLKNGNIAGIDTCIYDEHHYLVRCIGLEGNKVKYNVLYTNDAHGRIIHSKTIGDSINYETVSTYDENGRCIKIQSNYGNDFTTTINNFYNRKGLLIKTVSFSKQNGKTVTTKEYNNSGKMTKTKQTSPTSMLFTEHKYNLNNDLIESSTIDTYNKKETVARMIYTNYSNGLTFERIFVLNCKAISLEKIFYTYY